MVKYGNIEALTPECRRQGSSNSSVSSSSSDSEYYSPEEIVGKNAKRHKVRQSPKVKHAKVHKLMMSEADIPVSIDFPSTSTKNNITSEVDISEYSKVVEKNQELETLVSDLNHERRQLLQTLMEEFKGFFGKDKIFWNSGVEEADFNDLVKKVGKEVMTVKYQLESTAKENQEMKKYIEKCNADMARVEDENSILRARIQELENLPRPSCETCDNSKVVYEDTQPLRSKLADMAAQIYDLQRQNEKLEEEVIASKNDKDVRIRLESTIEELVNKVSDLEKRNKEMKEMIMIYEGTNEATKILESRVGDQEGQINELCSKNKKLEEEILSLKMDKERLVEQMVSKQHEIESLYRKERELIEQINTLQVENLNNEMERSRVDERRVIESEEMVKNLKMEIDSSNKKVSELEVILKETNEENFKLKENMKDLENKLYDLERSEVHHRERVSELEREASELSTKLSLRDEEFNTLQSQKEQLELKIARDRQEEATEIKNIALAKEREEKVSSGINSKEYEKIKGWFKGSKPSLQVIERKMEELVEEFRKHMEDNIRLMSQRIRVTEQLHVENKENYKITKERLEQENKLLESKTCDYLRILSTLDMATTRLKNVAEATHNMLSGLDLVCKHYDGRSEQMMNKMLKLSEELRYVKNWVVGTKKVNELLKGEMGALAEQLQRKKENDGLLRKKISELLEGKFESEGLMEGLEQLGEKMRGLEGMVKEKENYILDICEEKREVIRQLCVLIDYQKNKSDHFKQMIIQKNCSLSPRKC